MNSRFKKSKRIKKEKNKFKNILEKINTPIMIKSIAVILLSFLFIMLLKHIVSVHSSKKAFEKSTKRFL